ncbi:tRNA dihydrouridine synthase DusB [Desulfobulbus rhabdoformis]|uniref:tRNA dihydrouridine synthase DusB n=1 Tax=Desulfobulbus rhabdoformis TaxID=34032 RepID=UPI001962C6B1|nr:tRNA dihydrouridine synthase DusB [Desulfobulbus rhabdoformis]MBM9613615.1 tRNA dihydrouridine synthase DusB [Desulfobulbus rhabdoformis]
MTPQPTVYPALSIGALQLPSSLLLAPLAGYTDLPFRLLCKENGAALCYSEMVSCHGLLYEQKKTYELLATVPEERPFAVQLFGSEPEFMGRAAAVVSQGEVDLIDINMGCPVRKVVKKGSGAALMKNPSNAEAIIKAVCANTDLPITVKFRSGWTEETLNAPEFAQMAEAAGAQALTIHGRTWVQGFGGKADRAMIRAVKESVSIPVIGNGDVLCYADGLSMIEETGCDGVMVGRGALGNPWLFDPHGIPSTLSGRMPVIERYLQLAELYLPLAKVLFKVKNHTAKFLTGLNGASTLRHALYDCDDVQAIRDLLGNAVAHQREQ